MILVTGATGHFGKAAIQFLLKKGVAPNDIAALVRDEDKAADLKMQGVVIRKGDYDNYDSLVAAFKGVNKLLFVSGSDIGKRGPQQLSVVTAAKEAGVKYVLYTSFERVNESGTSPIEFVAASHLATEKAIKASGIPYTIFRNNLYADLIPVFLGEKVLETGAYWPSGETKTAFVLREDMAEAAANVLTSEGHEGKDYYISGNENISFAEIAAIISEASGKKVPFISPGQEEYKAALTGAGVPAEYVNLFAGFAEAIRQGEFINEKSDLEKLLGHKPASVVEFLKQTYAA